MSSASGQIAKGGEVLCLGRGPEHSDIAAGLRKAGHRVRLAKPDAVVDLDAIVLDATHPSQRIPFLELTDEAVESALARFVDMVAELQEALPLMRSDGSVVVIASSSYLGTGGAAHEAAFSAATMALMRCLSLESSSSRIRFNVIAVDPRNEAEVAGESTQCIAEVAAFLVSNESQMINGEILLANRGRNLKMRPARHRGRKPS